MHADVLLLFSANLALQQMRLQALVEVGHAYRGIDDREDDQNDCYDGKTGERFSYGKVVIFVAWLIHPSKLEDEIGQPAEEADNCSDHPERILPTSPESGQKEDENRDGNGGHGNPFLRVRETGHNHEELYSKAQEEEKIELQ